MIKNDFYLKMRAFLSSGLFMGANAFFMLLLVGTGIGMEILNNKIRPDGFFNIIDVGGFCMILAGLYAVQQYVSNLTVGLIRTSPYRFMMETEGMSRVSILGVMPGFAIAMTINVVFAIIRPEYAAGYRQRMLILAVMAAFMMVFLTVLFKFYIAGIILVYAIFLNILNIRISSYSRFAIGWGGTILIVCAIILVGIILSKIVSRLAYRKNISDSAFPMVMKQ